MRWRWMMVLGWLMVGVVSGCSRSAESRPPRLPVAPTVAPSPTLPPPVIDERDLPTATPTAPAPPTPSATPLPTPTPAALTLQIGTSTSGVPLTAHRIGSGPFKLVVAGDRQPLVAALRDHFRAHPQAVPETVSLWLVPAVNPDGVAVAVNADTSADGCPGNEWTQRDETYPFSLPEARALRDFSADALAAVLYVADGAELLGAGTGGAPAVIRDSCRSHVPGAELATVLQTATGYAVPGARPVAGRFLDYWAGQGIAAAAVAGAGDDVARHVAALEAVMAQLPALAAAEAAQAGGRLTWLDDATSGRRLYDDGAFVHAIALTRLGDTAYLLDGGRVLAVDLAQAVPPQALLRPGAAVDGVTVLEPLDLTDDGQFIYVLDRAGDVYRFDPATAQWMLDRYDRTVRDVSAHYFVAVAADTARRYLLETSYQFTLGYGPEAESLWNLPDELGVDVSSAGGGVFVLTETALRLYRETALVDGFRPILSPLQPRQVHATADAVYVLDHGGRRVLVYAPDNGRLRHIYQFADRRPVAALWSDGDQLILAGRNTLYFVGQPAPTVTVTGGDVLPSPRPHDPALLGGLPALIRPITGTAFASREFQMPGAPRHYRLGIHEGFDFYWQRGTQVLAAADGTVIRATHDYQEPNPAAFDYWRGVSLALGYTSAEAHDFYRGRQVWIDHGGGISTRYVHLSSIDPAVVVGATVSAGQVIARVGNSGSPGSLEGEDVDAHLHFELWVGEHYLGEYLRPIEIRAWVSQILR